mmetsp:Transcript_12646/g.24611  ORF Transcript_12646/g.24611 Transcript_12646/m.24611 type:complete len:92 (+) Transcript_12646:134-409(+)
MIRACRCMYAVPSVCMVTEGFSDREVKEGRTRNGQTEEKQERTEVSDSISSLVFLFPFPFQHCRVGTGRAPGSSPPFPPQSVSRLIDEMKT